MKRDFEKSILLLVCVLSSFCSLFKGDSGAVSSNIGAIAVGGSVGGLVLGSSLAVAVMLIYKRLRTLRGKISIIFLLIVTLGLCCII